VTAKFPTTWRLHSLSATAELLAGYVAVERRITAAMILASISE